MRHDTYIAGVKFRKGAREHLDKLEPGEALDFRREPENKFDKNAIAVWHGEQQLGYVPPDLAGDIAKLIDGGQTPRLVLTGGTRIAIHFDPPEAA